MATVVFGDFEWDEAKAKVNLHEHGVSFEEGATAFEDPNHLVVDDGSNDGETYWLIGFSIAGRLLTVVHVERGRRERIISARRATVGEEQRYGQARGEPSRAGGRETKGKRRKALADVARSRLDALRRLGFTVAGDDGVAMAPRGPQGDLWRPLEQYRLMNARSSCGARAWQQLRRGRTEERRWLCARLSGTRIENLGGNQS